jgi:transposase
MSSYADTSTLTAFGLAVEIGDWHRLDGRSIGAYLGLVPTESSFGGSRSQGSVTKTGNAHARRLLIEAAWHHRKPCRPGAELRRRQDRATSAARDRGQQANQRLHRRWVVTVSGGNRAPGQHPRGRSTTSRTIRPAVTNPRISD